GVDLSSPSSLVPVRQDEISSNEPVDHPCRDAVERPVDMGPGAVLPHGGVHPLSRRRRSRCLQHAPADLVLLDRFEQCPEIALTETFIALALDELEKD